MISVFTPLSKTGNQYIEAAWETLKTQTYTDWEWVVLENHGGKLPPHIRKDPRVRCHGNYKLEGIGALKRHCCELASAASTILFEFDHDDLLHETALEKAALALEDADFAYCDTAEFNDGDWSPNTYGSVFGWKSYEVEFQGHQLKAMVQPPVTAHNIRLIDWAPNHFRAFRKDAYWAVGGHNAELPVIDDHELILKFFLKGLRFKHVPECLYFYRVHGAQTTNASQKNNLIRETTEALYDQYIFDLAEKFCGDTTVSHYDRESDKVSYGPLQKIDLCGGIDTYKDYRPLDKSLGHDLDGPWPLQNDSVGVIRAYDAIEHLKSAIHIMNEAYRVLAPGGFFLIRVPSTDGRGAFQDPTHVSFWNSNSFWYYTKATHARYIHELTARFQLTRIKNFFPNDFCKLHNIVYTEAHLVALKDGYKPMGLVEI